MEDIQVQYNRELTELRRQLEERTKERDSLSDQKRLLEEKVLNLQQEVNRHVDKKFKAFVASS